MREAVCRRSRHRHQLVHLSCAQHPRQGGLPHLPLELTGPAHASKELTGRLLLARQACAVARAAFKLGPSAAVQACGAVQIVPPCCRSATMVWQAELSPQAEILSLDFQVCIQLIPSEGGRYFGHALISANLHTTYSTKITLCSAGNGTQ